MEVQLKKCVSKVVEPFLVTPGSGCFDLCCAENYLIYSKSVQVINIDFAVPPGFIGKIFTRSSWALKFTSAQGRVIDSDYRGKVKIICHNNLTSWHNITVGQSVAQITFLKSEKVKFNKVKDKVVKLYEENKFLALLIKNELFLNSLYSYLLG